MSLRLSFPRKHSKASQQRNYGIKVFLLFWPRLATSKGSKMVNHLKLRSEAEEQHAMQKESHTDKRLLSVKRLQSFELD